MANGYATIGDLSLVTSLADTNKLLIDDSTGGDTKAAAVSTLKDYLINSIVPEINETTKTWWVNGQDTNVSTGVDFTQFLQSSTITPVQDGSGKIQYNIRLSSKDGNLIEVDAVNGGLYAKAATGGTIQLWTSGIEYKIDDFVCYQNILYRCTTTPTQFTTFTTTDWTALSTVFEPYTEAEITTMITAVWGA